MQNTELLGPVIFALLKFDEVKGLTFFYLIFLEGRLSLIVCGYVVK